MTSPALRDRQTELTRDLILEALAAVIREGHLSDFSMQDVADRAGVSLRTVYRHFVSREALLEAYVVWVEELMAAVGGLRVPHSLDEVASVVVSKFAATEKYLPLLIAHAKVDSAIARRRELAAAGMASLQSALAEVTDQLDPKLAEAVVWTMRMIGSHRTFARLHEEAEIDAANAGAAAAWAIELMIQALREGRGPTPTRTGAAMSERSERVNVPVPATSESHRQSMVHR